MIWCRKCRCEGEQIVLREFWTDHGIEFDQNDDGTVEREGILFNGNPYKVVAKCWNCGHSWTLRKITQITQLPQRAETKAGR